MSLQSKSFLFSAALHLAALALAVMIAAAPDARRKPIVVDLSVETIPPAGKQGRAADDARAAKTPVLSRPQKVLQTVARTPRPSPETPAPAPAQRESQIPQIPFTEGQVPVAATQGPLPALSTATGATQNRRSAGTTSGLGTGGGTVDYAQGVAEIAKKEYLKEHFAAIRDSIMKRISYPMLARKKGWAGTVKVSFIVCEDGRVRDVRIVAGSGFEILDRKAVETVLECSPYPKPPVMAEVIMPITYRLD
jgi:periplasmic protein TonB